MNEMELLKTEIRKEWVAVSQFLSINATHLILEEGEHCVSGTFELDGKREWLPNFKPGDDVRLMVIISLARFR